LIEEIEVAIRPTRVNQAWGRVDKELKVRSWILPDCSISIRGHWLVLYSDSIAKFRRRALVGLEAVPITEANPFKGRQYPGQVIVTAVRWYLRYPLAYEHVSELLSEQGVPVDASCIWRWVQAFAPELSKRCRQHLKPVNKSYRVDETYSALSS
jgi:transposase-like protein